MSQSFIQVAVDGLGKKMQTWLNTILGHDVHAEAVVLVNSSGVELASLPVTVSGETGAPNANIVRGTATGTAATLAIARATRRGIVIRNVDETYTIWVGPATVTIANGFPILPGEAFPVTWVGEIQVIRDTGNPTYAAWDEYT